MCKNRFKGQKEYVNELQNEMAGNQHLINHLSCARLWFGRHIPKIDPLNNTSVIHVVVFAYHFLVYV